MQGTTVKIKREKISERILIQIADNLVEDLYLVFYAENSLQLPQGLKDQILREVLTRHLRPAVLQQRDFGRFYEALQRNIRTNLEYMRHVKKTSLLSLLYKEEMIVNLMLDQLEHEAMAHFPEEELDEETLSQYDDLISMYGDVPPLDDPLGRELRIQMHIIKNSQLNFADPEKRAELLEELLMQKDDSGEFREFFIIDSLHRAMGMNRQEH